MSQLTKILLCVGSNYMPEENMVRAKGLMKDLFPDIFFTRDVWTEPIGINSDKFLNCLASAYTYHGIKQIEMAIKQIEHKCGRKKPEAHNGIIKMDIDILLFGDMKLHEDDWNRPYISELIEEINYLK